MTASGKKGSSTSNRTINSLSFDKRHIDDVLADIQLASELGGVQVCPTSSSPSSYNINLKTESQRIQLANMAVMGEKYLVIFDPRLERYKEEDKDLFDKEINPAYKKLREILLQYVDEKIRRYIESTTPESS